MMGLATPIHPIIHNAPDRSQNPKRNSFMEEDYYAEQQGGQMRWS